MALRISHTTASLRFFYCLLSLAVADLGWLIARLGNVAPTVSGLTPILFMVGFPLLVVGVIGSLGWLISFVWLLIAYRPELREVSPERIKFYSKLLLAFIVFNGTAHFALRPHPASYKSRIIFKDPVLAVQDSMKVLRQLCESVEAKQFLSFHVQPRDSTLFFSVPVTRNLESLTENLGRIDTVTAANKGFRYMKKENIVRLLSVIRFLNRNLISGIIHDGSWRYIYGLSVYNENQWFSHDNEEGVYLYLYDTPDDIRKPWFNYFYTIKAQNEQLVLISTNKVPNRSFR